MGFNSNDIPGIPQQHQRRISISRVNDYCYDGVVRFGGTFRRRQPNLMYMVSSDPSQSISRTRWCSIAMRARFCSAQRLIYRHLNSMIFGCALIYTLRLPAGEKNRGPLNVRWKKKKSPGYKWAVLIESFIINTQPSPVSRTQSYSLCFYFIFLCIVESSMRILSSVILMHKLAIGAAHFFDWK